MKQLIVLLLVFSSSYSVTIPFSDTCNQDALVTDGIVNAMLEYDNKIYIGGTFSRLGHFSGSGVVVRTSTGGIEPKFAKVNGNVHCVQPDGEGGWFIGGDFSKVDGKPIRNLAHILSDGSVVASWKPNPNNIVTSMSVSAENLYVVGIFDTLDNQYRKRIASVNIVTGHVTSWAPIFIYQYESFIELNTIVVYGENVFVGGAFDSVGSQLRHSIACINRTTGIATSWDASITGVSSVSRIVVSGSQLYVLGYFYDALIGGQTRSCLASFDVSTGTLLSWNPIVDGWVNDLFIDGTKIYFVGPFSNVGGQKRDGIACVDASTGALLDWNPAIASSIVATAICVIGNNVYIGGEFNKIGIYDRSYIASIDVVTASVTNWKLELSNSVKTLCASGTLLYVGGYFTSTDCIKRNKLACIDALSGELTSWAPNLKGARINTINRSNERIIIGGVFDSVSSQPRKNLAAIDANSAELLNWAPNPDHEVTAVEVVNEKVYVGGQFKNIGGKQRTSIACVNFPDGNATNWDPGLEQGIYVSSIKCLGSNLYVGGSFSVSIADQSRNNLICLDTVYGTFKAWSPNPNATVSTIFYNTNTLFISGHFTQIDGTNRNGICSFNHSTGALNVWAPSIGGSITAGTISNGIIYLGGRFTEPSGEISSGIAAIDTGTSASYKLFATSDDMISKILPSGNTLYVGGNFRRIGQGIGHNYFAQYGQFYAAPIVSTISPTSDTNNGIVNITNITGTNFRTGTKVYLAKNDTLLIPSISTTINSSTSISCNIDLTNKASGYYNVIVSNVDEKADTILNGFRVIPAPPAPISPLNNATNQSLTTELKWHKSTYDSLYILQLSSTSNFALKLINDNEINDTVVTIPPGMLVNNTSYYWRVASIKKGGDITAFSNAYKFTTLPLAPINPTLILPLANELNVPLAPLFSWNQVPNAASYRLQVSKNVSFASLNIDTLVPDSCSIKTKELNQQSLYYWRVSASNAGGTSIWSEVRAFTTSDSLPEKVTLVYPNNEDSIKNLYSPMTLIWNKSTRATAYAVELASDSLFANVLCDSILTDTFLVTDSVRENSFHYWRVKAQNAIGWGMFSNTGRFYIGKSMVAAEAVKLPTVTSMSTPYGSGIVKYSLANDAHVRIRLYDIRGRVAECIADKSQKAGYYTVALSKPNLNTGLYFVDFVADNVRIIKKYIVIK